MAFQRRFAQRIGYYGGVDWSPLNYWEDIDEKIGDTLHEAWGYHMLAGSQLQFQWEDLVGLGLTISLRTITRGRSEGDNVYYTTQTFIDLQHAAQADGATACVENRLRPCGKSAPTSNP